VSLSIGICELADAPDVRTLIMRADNALYTAKHAGRATIRSWTRDDEPVGAQILARRHGLLGLRALARAADLRDAPTQRHSERVAQIVSLLAREAGWSRADVAAIIAAGVVHDVGKVAVPDAVLVKPAALDAIEYELVKRHAVVGAEITAEILDHAQTAWVRHHHERWDGRGYPDGLAGETIPLGARLLAIADALDVMVSARVYKPAMSLETALEECRRQSGQQFCPQVVAVLEAAVAKGAMRVPMA
jgi:HD-GYP domain-containing protein (c-di-GMP phosphodiesterase class II)